MRTAIVSDSNCGISKSEADNMGLFILPMPVCIENTFYYEGIDLTRKTFSAIWQTMKKSILHSLPRETC